MLFKKHIRLANLSDLDKIIEIYNSTIASRMVTADTVPISVESRIELFKEHIPKKRPLWVVENDQREIIAWISYQSFYGRPAYDATAEISIYIDETKRAIGLGKELLQFCIDVSPSLNIKTLIGIIFSHNEPSIKLFYRLGFEEWGRLPNVAILDGIERSVS